MHLLLVSIASVLGAVELALMMRELGLVGEVARSGRVASSVLCVVGSIQAVLVEIGKALLAVADALIELRDRLIAV
jgi:hypothetical protein